MTRVNLLVRFLIVLLACAACGESQTAITSTEPPLTTTTTEAWTLQDFKDAVSFCTTLDIAEENCPGLVRDIRDGLDCSVEEAFLLMARYVQIRDDTSLAERDEHFSQAEEELCS